VRLTEAVHATIRPTAAERRRSPARSTRPSAACRSRRPATAGRRRRDGHVAGGDGASLASYDPARVHGYRLSRADLGREIARLGGATQPERERMIGLDPRRADVIFGVR
jgi:hypothetical protein